jgi:hypothetical protein
MDTLKPLIDEFVASNSRDVPQNLQQELSNQGLDETVRLFFFLSQLKYRFHH